VPDFKLFFNSDVSVDLHNNLAFISFRKEPLEDLTNLFKKRIFDLLFSFFVWAIFLWWLLPLIAILVKLTSKGPALFKQIRSGRTAKSFVCYKFRTMESDPSATQPNDGSPALRITRLGYFLRLTSLDELPQFINVLLGEMSVVGPRPHMLQDTAEYKSLLDTYMIRLYLKPGITGLAQISGHRGKLSFTEMRERLKKDIYYMEHWGMWLDIQIIIKTVRLVLKGDPKAN
jgi:lipopolysaccharide/colanic/teichoic acid biosynthesis glycosyltransferase